MGARSSRGGRRSYKLIEAPKPELYDLAADPGETTNRAAAENAARSRPMRDALQAALARPVPDAAAAVDAGDAERLRALGYVGGGAAARAPRARPRATRRTASPLLRGLNTGMMAVRTDPAARDPRADGRARRRTPGCSSPAARWPWPTAAAGQYERAVAELRRLAKETTLSAEDEVVLGDNLRFAGRLEEAAAVLRETARKNPRFAQPLALAGRGSHQGRQARGGDGRLRARAGDRARPHRGPARPRRPRGRSRRTPRAAEKRYGRILEVDPADAGALSKLGVVRMRAGRPEEAIALFRRAIEREPKNGEALLYLAGALASTGRAAEALPFFERALDAGQRNPMALNGLALTRMALGDRPGAAAGVPRVAAPRPEAAGRGAGAGRAAIPRLLLGPAPRPRTARAPRPSGRPRGR